MPLSVRVDSRILVCVAVTFLVYQDAIVQGSPPCRGVTLTPEPEPVKNFLLDLTCAHAAGCSGLTCNGTSKLPVLLSSFTFTMHVDACATPITGSTYFGLNGKKNQMATIKNGQVVSILDGQIKDKPDGISAYFLFEAKRQQGNVTVTVYAVVDVLKLTIKSMVFQEQVDVNASCHKYISGASGSSSSVPTVTTPSSSPSTVTVVPSTSSVQSSIATVHVMPNPSLNATLVESHNSSHISVQAASSPTPPLPPVRPSSTPSVLPINPSTSHKATTASPTASVAPPKKQHGNGHPGSSGMSQTVKILIFVGVLFVLLLCVAFVFYCRRRKRARPAYYNDIAINDPIRDDDDDDDTHPLFNAHLVL